MVHPAAMSSTKPPAHPPPVRRSLGGDIGDLRCGCLSPLPAWKRPHFPVYSLSVVSIGTGRSGPRSLQPSDSEQLAALSRGLLRRLQPDWEKSQTMWAREGHTHGEVTT